MKRIPRKVPTKNCIMPTDEIPATRFTKLNGATGSIRIAATPTIPLRFNFSSIVATLGPPIFRRPAFPATFPIANNMAELSNAPIMP